MSRSLIVVGTVAVLAGAVGAYWWYFVREPQELSLPAPVAPAAPPAQVAASPPAPPPAPAIAHPLEPAASAVPLPALDESDGVAIQALTELIGAKPFADLFDSENLVRRIVVMVDNLPRAKLGRRMTPVKPAPGAFRVSGEGDTRAVAADNAGRYKAYVRLAEAVDTAKLVDVYRRLYPLFQRAYAELGNSDGYFNDRLVEVIDHLLATPTPPSPLRLVRPKIFYEFADSDLEARSSGQKILLRMGTQNAERIKAKLRELRSAITADKVGALSSMRQGVPVRSVGSPLNAPGGK